MKYNCYEGKYGFLTKINHLVCFYNGTPAIVIEILASDFSNTNFIDLAPYTKVVSTPICLCYWKYIPQTIVTLYNITTN